MTGWLFTEPAVLIRLADGLHILIDAKDLPLVVPFGWCAQRNYPAALGRRLCHYVQGHVGGRSISLHRYLLRPAGGLFCDHVNGDGLDNRRSVNLREVTRQENAANRHHHDAPLSLGQLPAGVPIIEIVGRGASSRAAPIIDAVHKPEVTLPPQTPRRPWGALPC